MPQNTLFIHSEPPSSYESVSRILTELQDIRFPDRSFIILYSDGQPYSLALKVAKIIKKKKLTFKFLSIRRLENDWKKITCSAHLLRQFCRHILAREKLLMTDNPLTDQLTIQPSHQMTDGPIGSLPKTFCSAALWLKFGP